MPKMTNLITHTPKFNIGNVIYHNIDPKRILTVFAILHEEQDFVGPWFGRVSRILENCYVFTNNQDQYITWDSFKNEDNYVLLSSNCLISTITTEKSLVFSCPNCKGELIDKYSEWAGKDIKKCKACGWC